MNDFIFQNTTRVYFGKNQLSHLPAEISKWGSRVLLVYGGGSIKKTGLYDRVMAALQPAGIQVWELPGVEPNPRHTTVNRGAALCREENIQAVLAVGGGSCIDCAKAIAAAACYGGDVWDLVEGKAPVAQALAVIAMPTLASTGSEMDKSCVISNLETAEKKGLSSELLRPRAAFLDPTNTLTVGPFQTACGGFDIMTHFLELNYFTKAEKYPMLRGVIESILHTVSHDLPVVLAQPDNYAARADLLWTASWALNSFCGSGQRQAASCHSLEHELSAQYDLTHGLGLAILFPRWMEYLLARDQTVAADFARFGTAVLDCPPAADPEDGAKAAIEALKKFLYETLGLKSSLSACGIDDSRFEEMARAACKGGVIDGYRPLTVHDAEAIYRMCL